MGHIQVTSELRITTQAQSIGLPVPALVEPVRSQYGKRTLSVSGYFYVGVSDPLKNLAPNLFPLQNENGVELYYNVQATPWCQITPDLQVIDPFRQRAVSSLLFGLRAKIDF